MADLAGALKSTGLFTEVAQQTSSRDGPDLIVRILRTPRRPDYRTPADNPALLLLSLALPVWWSEPAGYAFAATYTATNRTIVVDTTWDGTVVAWSAAPLLSLIPGRTVLRSRAAEAARLRRLLELSSAQP